MQLINWLALLRLLAALVLVYPSAPAALATCKWQEVFGDNFNQTQLDTKKWSTKYPPGNNGELQYYAPDAFEVKNGVLRIKAEKRNVAGRQYTSGIITSINSFSQQYGYFEMQAKVPKGKGLWPGFWLLPKKAHYPWEVDIFELLGKQPDTLYMTHHWQDPKNGHEKYIKPYTGADFSTDFHTFELEWNPTALIWYVDGHVRYWTTQGVPHEPMFLLANLAVGGDWPGNPDDSTAFPSYYEIDYIKVYKRVCGQALLPASASNVALLSTGEHGEPGTLN